MPLHLIPTPIAPNQLEMLPQVVLDIIPTIEVWVVEELRTARRFLKSVSKKIDIDSLTFYNVNEHYLDAPPELEQHFANGQQVGLMSEAGCPAIADPGTGVVMLAHCLGVEVIPHIGPSSILLALMASGLQGQRFCFLGYLPIPGNERANTLRQLEKKSSQNKESQIFIETPYRSEVMLKEICTHCHGTTMLCVAVDLGSPPQQIITQSIFKWKTTKIEIRKKPAVFILLAY